MNPETPRTEALWVGLRNRHWSRGDQPICDIMASHEQLERELADQKAHADEIYKAAAALAAKLEDDLAAAKEGAAAEICRLNRDLKRQSEQAERHRVALLAERALADRLANVLEDIAFGVTIRRKAGGCGQSLICTPEQLQNYAHRALAAWKEARRGAD